MPPGPLGCFSAAQHRTPARVPHSLCCPFVLRGCKAANCAAQADPAHQSGVRSGPRLSVIVLLTASPTIRARGSDAGRGSMPAGGTAAARAVAPSSGGRAQAVALVVLLVLLLAGRGAAQVRHGTGGQVRLAVPMLHMPAARRFPSLWHALGKSIGSLPCTCASLTVGGVLDCHLLAQPTQQEQQEDTRTDAVYVKPDVRDYKGWNAVRVTQRFVLPALGLF